MIKTIGKFGLQSVFEFILLPMGLVFGSKYVEEYKLGLKLGTNIQKG